MDDQLFLTTRYIYGDDRVIIGDKDKMWVRCGDCGKDIERTKRLANNVFTCLDCRERKNKSCKKNRHGI